MPLLSLQIERIFPGRHDPRLWSEHVNRYLFAKKYAKGEVLDVACGVGYGTSYLAKAGLSVIAGDISAEAIKYAKKHFAQDADFVLLDAHSLPFRDMAFQTIISIETIEHLQRYKDALSECRRVLQSGGLFICSTPNKKASSPWSWRPVGPYHYKEFYPNEFSRLLGNFFGEILLVRGQAPKDLFWTFRHSFGPRTTRFDSLLVLILNVISGLISGDIVVSFLYKIGIDYRPFWNTGIRPFKDGLFFKPLYMIWVARKKGISHSRRTVDK